MDINNIVIAVSAGLIALIGAVLVGFRGVVMAYFDSWMDRIKRQRYAHGFDTIADFYQTFESIASLKSIERHMLLEGKDSGGLPTPGKPYTVRALLGKTKVEGKEDPPALYGFDILVDLHYCEMLKRIIQDGHILISTATMPECFLKNCYTSEGVTQSLICYVGIVENNLVFTSFSKYSGEFTRSDIIAIGLGVAKLRSKLAL